MYNNSEITAVNITVNTLRAEEDLTVSAHHTVWSDDDREGCVLYIGPCCFCLSDVRKAELIAQKILAEARAVVANRLRRRRRRVKPTCSLCHEELMIVHCGGLSLVRPRRMTRCKGYRPSGTRHLCQSIAATDEEAMATFYPGRQRTSFTKDTKNRLPELRGSERTAQNAAAE